MDNMTDFAVIYPTILEQHIIEFTEKLNVGILLPYLQASDQLSENDMFKLRNVSPVESRDILFDIIRRKCPNSFVPFYEGLVKTGQIELAKLLASNVPSLPPIESYKHSSKDFRAENCSEIAMPSKTAINENQRFYSAEIDLFPSVPKTCGVIEDLTVEAVDVAPSMLAFDSESIYRNFTTPKGLALVFNNRKFHTPGLPERIGTDVDATNITNLLQKLDYRVKVKQNLTASEMMAAMERFAKKKEHETCDSTVVVVLTHGSDGGVYGSDNRSLTVEKFVGCLNSVGCPALVDKPKLFIIQACRGERYDAGHLSIDGSVSSHEKKFVEPENYFHEIFEESDGKNFSKKIPKEADILIAYATTPGYVSWRNSVHGSWFIQSICEVFRQKAKKEEVQHLLTEVNRLVADRLSSCGHVQVPEPCSRLRKKFYFFPGIYY